MRRCDAVAGEKGAVKGLLTFKSRFLPDFSDRVIRRAQLMRRVIEPQPVDVGGKSAVQLPGKDSGDIIFVKVQLLRDGVQCQRFLKMIGDVGDETVADLRVVPAVSGNQRCLLKEIRQNQMEPRLADSGASCAQASIREKANGMSAFCVPHRKNGDTGCCVRKM